MASVTPASGASDVALDADVVVDFSEPVDPATVTAVSASLKLGVLTVPVSRTLENSDRRLRIHPTSGLGNNTQYSLTLVDDITDVAGNPLAGTPVTTSFTTVTASATVNDGTGDTFGVGVPQHDITMFSGQQGSITIVIQFNAAIARASANVANSVGGYVDIDVDQNGATGSAGATDAFRLDAGSTGLGIEYLVNLFDNVDGSLSVQDGQGNVVGAVTPTFGATSITFTIPQSLLGNDDGNVDLATVVGTLAEPTDIAPNAGHVTLGVSGLPGAPQPAAARVPLAGQQGWRWGR